MSTIRMALGVAIVRATYLVPHIGGWIKLGVIIWGMGAIALAVYKRLEKQAPASTPGAPQTAPAV